MRIAEKITEIDYDDTKHFFKNRAEKFNIDNPYSVTMYQDNNAKLVEERNLHEVAKLLPLLKVRNTSKVLDIGCGIGRWADALPNEITEYCGIDFSKELIEIAKKRINLNHFSFYEGATNGVEKILNENEKGKYNTILMIGILLYLNDNDSLSLFEQIQRISEEHTIIVIREPVGIEKRLTLKNFFSEELKDNYNAIYRTSDELLNFFEKTILKNGFKITNEGFLFDEDALNNRKETAQYYFVLER